MFTQLKSSDIVLFHSKNSPYFFSTGKRAEKLEALRELQTRLNTYKLKTQKNIDEKIMAILKQNKCADLIGYEIHKGIQYKIRHKKRGAQVLLMSEQPLKMNISLSLFN